jgi:hypothetical protein
MFERVWQHKMLFGVGLVALGIGFTGCGGGGAPPGQPASSGQPPAASHSGSHSPAYNQGYDEGNQHMAPHIAMPADCYLAAGRNRVERRDSADWIQGCIDGIRDMNAEGQSGGPGSGGPGTPTPSVDCSNPANRFNGACF